MDRNQSKNKRNRKFFIELAKEMSKESKCSIVLDTICQRWEFGFKMDIDNSTPLEEAKEIIKILKEKDYRYDTIRCRQNYIYFEFNLIYKNHYISNKDI